MQRLARTADSLVAAIKTSRLMLNGKVLSITEDPSLTKYNYAEKAVSTDQQLAARKFVLFHTSHLTI